MGDFVPDGADGGLREILVACLDQSPGEIFGESVPLSRSHARSLISEKRIPAPILLASPWFGRHRIGCVDDAVAHMKEYLAKYERHHA